MEKKSEIVSKIFILKKTYELINTSSNFFITEVGLKTFE